MHLTNAVCKITRKGSEVDYKNISRLFKDLNFDIVKTEAELTDLTAKVNYLKQTTSLSLQLTKQCFHCFELF